MGRLLQVIFNLGATYFIVVLWLAAAGLALSLMGYFLTAVLAILGLGLACFIALGLYNMAVKLITGKHPDDVPFSSVPSATVSPRVVPTTAPTAPFKKSPADEAAMAWLDRLGSATDEEERELYERYMSLKALEEQQKIKAPAVETDAEKTKRELDELYVELGLDPADFRKKA